MSIDNYSEYLIFFFYCMYREKYISPRSFRSFYKRDLPLNANFRITASVDSSCCHHISAVVIARIRVQCQYVAAVNVADDRRQHYGKNPPRSHVSRFLTIEQRSAFYRRNGASRYSAFCAFFRKKKERSRSIIRTSKSVDENESMEIQLRGEISVANLLLSSSLSINGLFFERILL